MRLGVLKRQTLINERRTKQVGEANTGGSRAEEQILFVLQFGALQLGSVDHSGKRYASRALHVVVVDTVIVAITLEQVDCVYPGPIFEMNAALRKYFLNRFDEFVHKGIELLGRWALLTNAKVERIVQILLIISTGIEIHRKQILRWNAGACGVELQLADRNSGAVCPKISQSKNATAVGHTNEPNILLWPVFQDLLHLAAVFDREIHAACVSVDVTELQTCFSDGRVVDDRQKPRRIGHDRAIEERLVMVEEIDQVNITLEVHGFVAKLHQHPA